METLLLSVIIGTLIFLLSKLIPLTCCQLQVLILVFWPATEADTSGLPVQGLMMDNDNYYYLIALLTVMRVMILMIDYRREDDRVDKC